MPIVNAYYSEPELLPELEKMTSSLKQLVAKELTCGDRALQPNEISVRLIEIKSAGMLAKVELEIFAAPYKERVKNQDQICLSVKDFVLKTISQLDGANVWLILAELGHSWQ